MGAVAILRVLHRAPSFLAGLLGLPLDAGAQERITAYRQELLKGGILRDLKVDGYTYAVADTGRGEPIVLLHGLGGSIYDWRHLLKPLAKDRRVIAIDFLGAGESDKPGDADYSIDAQARRVKGILDELKAGPATIVGNSYGGGVAMMFAQDWPERTKRLVLIDSVCYAENVPAYVALSRIPGAGSAARIFPVGFYSRRALRGCYKDDARLSDEEVESYVKELAPGDRRAALVQTVRDLVPSDTREFLARLRLIRMPTLVIWGTDDQTIPVELGRRLAGELPNARMLEIDSGHVPNQERPAEVLAGMRTFLGD